MEAGFDCCEDVVRLEADDIVQKASELINFRLNFNHRPGIFHNEAHMISNLGLKLQVFRLVVDKEVLLLQNFQVILALVVSLQV